jgi:plastocyanin
MRRSIVLVVCVSLAACGGGGASDTTAASPGDVTTIGTPVGSTAGGDSDFVVIEVTGIAYPDSVTIPAGKSVEFHNTSGVKHTVTFDTWDGDEFDSEFDLNDGAEVGFPLPAGTYEYHCAIHSSMHGELVVEG